jgi:N-carbamoyl-L-amino-acid hydrolase
MYDGTVGVLGGLEAIRALKRSGFRPRRSIELVMFTSEEPTRFGIGCLGSRLLSGTLDSGRADALQDKDEVPLSAVRTAADRDRSSQCACQTTPRLIELHIEQGPLLEREVPWHRQLASPPQPAIASPSLALAATPERS